MFDIKTTLNGRHMFGLRVSTENIIRIQPTLALKLNSDAASAGALLHANTEVNRRISAPKTANFKVDNFIYFSPY